MVEISSGKRVDTTEHVHNTHHEATDHLLERRTCAWNDVAIERPIATRFQH